jgi:RNA-binding protein YhbY|tara:strand:+ start:69 stop:326 length:258 start_codon:yes stop_codon:yes gene_type:complete
MKGRDRRNLKSLAKVRSIDLKIGKKGLTSNFLEEARKILLRDGMIKMSHTLLKNERHDVISKIELLLSVQLIEKVGKTLTFHKIT